MPLAPGTRIGVYEIVDALGAGGMGEVYRARDTKLRRDVAIKILPEAFALDPERVARFQREAELLASLNHPNIAAIYGVEGSGDTNAIVMELVEGETLGGPLPLEDALAIARQIVDALEAAHERGVIHRDLKPANIKITPEGKVKVLDFGLAKAIEAGGAGGAGGTGRAGGLSLSPTLSVHATYAGVILGTAAYMSPEQARGKPVDRRTDIWAFGCVLYEMLAGKQAFDAGETVSDAIATILKGDVDWGALPAATPAHVRSLLRRCLQKDPQRRLPHIGVVRLDLDEAESAAPAERGVVERGVSATIRSQTRERIVWATALAACIVAAVLVTRWSSGRVADLPEMRVDINVPPTTDPFSFALSPDGLAMAFVAAGSNGSQLWVRRLDSLAPRSLPGTEGAQFPFWSPDSQSVGFFAGNKLRRTDVVGGTPQALTNVITPAGGTWRADGTILFVPNSAGQIFRISANGGSATPLTPRSEHDSAQRFPYFLPDGDHFLFYMSRSGAGSQPAGVYIGALDRTDAQFLLTADGSALYTSGHIFFVRQGALLAQSFDPQSMRLIGSATHVADDVAIGASSILPASASAAGSIAYRSGGTTRLRRLVWFDRSGKELGVASDERALATSPSLSPDGRTVAMQVSTQQNTDVWLLDLERKVSTRLTIQPGIDALPVWSPDGARIVFNSFQDKGNGLYVKGINGAKEEEVHAADRSDVATACDWSPDGRFILYRSVDQPTGTYDLWALPVAGDRKPIPVVRTPFDERDGQFSPDGNWLAYQSDESGKPEIYVQPFPGPGTKIRISANGGTQVRWRRDGQELFYIGADNQLMAVSLKKTSSGQLEIGASTALFKTRILGLTGVLRQQYVVTADAQRFLINVVGDDASTSPITLLVNWKPRSQ